MNLNENEIRMMSLVNRQKLFVDLSTVPMNDKSYPNAQAAITFIKKTKGWEEPEKDSYTALADVVIDGVEIKSGQEVQLHEWQVRAHARAFINPDDLEKATNKGKERKQDEPATVQLTQERIGEIAAAAGKSVVEELFKRGVLKAAALLILSLMLCLNATAGPLTPLLSAGPILNGGTNFLNGSSTSNYFVPVITTTIITNPAITLSNGSVVSLSATVTNYTTNIPALYNCSKFDNVEVSVTFDGAVAGVVSNTLTTTWYKTTDGTTNTAVPAFTLVPAVTSGGVNGAHYSASTNYNIGAAYGLICMTASNAGTNNVTNVLAQVQGKNIRSGP